MVLHSYRDLVPNLGIILRLEIELLHMTGIKHHLCFYLWKDRNIRDHIVAEG